MSLHLAAINRKLRHSRLFSNRQLQKTISKVVCTITSECFTTQETKSETTLRPARMTHRHRCGAESVINIQVMKRWTKGGETGRRNDCHVTANTASLRCRRMEVAFKSISEDDLSLRCERKQKNMVSSVFEKKKFHLSEKIAS